jgi:hypothetical protein
MMNVLHQRNHSPSSLYRKTKNMQPLKVILIAGQFIIDVSTQVTGPLNGSIGDHRFEAGNVAFVRNSTQGSQVNAEATIASQGSLMKSVMTV